MTEKYSYLKNISNAKNKSPFFSKIKSLIWVFIVLFIVIYFMFIHHKNPENNKNIKKESSYDASLININNKLRENLSRLESMGKHSSAENNNKNIGLKNRDLLGKLKNNKENKNNYSKAYLARLAAPTTAFEDSSLINSGNSLATGNNNKINLNGTGSNVEFSNQKYSSSTITAKKIENPERVIPAGDILQASLNTASDSDLPGMVSATLSQPVFSLVDQNKLVPAGSQLIGQYSSSVMQGQSRVFIMWNRLILPNGTTIDINSPGADGLGVAGSGADYVNRHFWDRFGHASLLSILGAGVANYNVSSADQYNSSSEYRTAVANSLQESADQALQNDMAIKPTLKLYQGKKITVFVAHDLFFPIGDD